MRVFLTLLILAASTVTAMSRTGFERISPHFIAALGDADSNSGNGAEKWGYWPLDPGKNGVWLRLFPILRAAGGYAPGNLQFDENDWWLDENGLLMQKPEFPIKPGKYLVTGEREVTTVLTVFPPDTTGNMRWELQDNASLFDVTHMPCRSARYRPAKAGEACSPSFVDRSVFRIPPGTAMPKVPGCNKLDYSVLIVVGLPE